jgi:hypothetical protein
VLLGFAALVSSFLAAASARLAAEVFSLSLVFIVFVWLLGHWLTSQDGA